MTNIKENSEIQLYISREEKNGITQELLQKLFDYKDGVLYWKVNSSKKIHIGQIAGSLTQEKYAPRYRTRINHMSYYIHRLIFLYHYGYVPKEIDHKDRNTLNNKIENLREATHIENCRNRNSVPKSSSQYLGVRISTIRKKYTLKNGEIKLYEYSFWLAKIVFNKVDINLGCFKDERLAALAYNRAAVKYFGEFSNLNIIKPI